MAGCDYKIVACFFMCMIFNWSALQIVHRFVNCNPPQNEIDVLLILGNSGIALLMAVGQMCTVQQI